MISCREKMRFRDQRWHCNMQSWAAETLAVIELRLSICVLAQVEKAPVMLKELLKKEEADELKTKLEAGVLSSNAPLGSFWCIQ